MPNGDDQPLTLNAVCKTYAALKQPKWAEDKQGRGRAFESTVCDLFDIHDLLDRGSFHTEAGRAEQLDGAVSFPGFNALLEVKWVESGLAASELFSFIGKVDGKFVGTVGIFVSYEPLSENFLNALRLGRRQSVIVIHGEDINLIFTEDFPLKEYLIAHIKYLSQENMPHYSAKRFLQSRKPIQIPPTATPNDRVSQYLQHCL